MKNKIALVESLIFTYQSKENTVNSVISDNNLWLTQKSIADLFDTEANNVSYHINEVYASKELDEKATHQNFRLVQKEGKREVERNLNFYSLEMIIAVGFRVNSSKATEFRNWAINVLKNYTIKGYVLDNKRLANGAYLTKDYYDELLEEIRLIRLSERRLYQKVTDLFSTAIDYDAKDNLTLEFFKTVQNKLHYAVSGSTASEIIMSRADSKKENMGLKTWNNAPSGRIHRSDVVVAKNYLEKDELSSLSRLVEMYLDFGEEMATRNIPLTMTDYIKRLDLLLQFNGREILDNPGKVSREVAEKFALSEFEKFRIIQEQRLISDFDLFISDRKFEEIPEISKKKQNQ